MPDSMRGDFANLPEICRLKKNYNARLFVDDAHGFGVIGPTGRGTGEHFGLQDEIDIYFGTFAKTFVGAMPTLTGMPVNCWTVFLIWCE